MRKCSFFLALLMVIGLFIPITAEGVSFSPSLDIYSEAVYMVNLNSGEVVYKKNENKSLFPASLTKIMTAVILLEQYKGKPDELKKTLVSAPSSAYDDFAGQNVSTADIRIGEKVSYEDLLYALLLPSACEAANIIAYNVGNGNINNFVKMMNDKAKELGCTNTNFANAHGLYDASQVTSARDMAIITRYAMSLPRFTDIANTTTHTLAATSVHPNGTLVKHTNAMLFAGQYSYKYAKGIKTGTLDEAGRCLISTASKDGVDYLIVSMKAPMKDQDGNNKFYNCLDHITLYNWAFGKLSYAKILDKKTVLTHIAVDYGKDAVHVNLTAKDDFTALWPKDVDYKTAVRQKYIMEDSVIAPVKQGDKLGKLELIYNGDVIFTTDLIAAQSVKRNVPKYKISVAKQFPSSNMMKIAIYICIGIIALYTAFFIFKNKKKRRKKFRTKTSKKRF